MSDVRTRQPWTLVGLKEAEYQQVVTDLGREPNPVELQMYGVLWSEHCAYKHSRQSLKRLPTTGERVLQGPGEGAGVIDVGDGQAVAFKIESHNHPSFIEPFQGAATGVGGILRDVFSMGARPIAMLDSLRFGPLADPKQRYLLEGAVAGIGFYGNCMGIPTVGGEVYFDESYAGNCLVNAMCAGLVPKTGIRRGIAQGTGNPIMVVGARTGRDGIGGASLLASQEFGALAEEKRPSVQVGDPFLEKLLLEACLELLETDAVVGIQDCGAAGLTSACTEMAYKGGVGLELDADRVPRREAGMQPWEVMISESQERMVVCVQQGREDEVRRIFAKWDLESAVIGRVTDDGLIRITAGGEVVAEMPAASIAGGGPAYTPEKREPADLAEVRAYDFDRLPEPQDYNQTLLMLLRSPNLCSREWIYRQYDHQVLLNTVILPGGDAALLRLPGTNGRGIALKTDCNSRYVFLNPRRGAAIAVAEAARNVVCTGAEPAAITNNLNFGNPEKPEIFWQFDEAVSGIAEACEALGTPVTGGNVSFYNETNGTAIYPTPTIGMVGVHPNVERRATVGFKQPGDVIVLLGTTRSELGGSEYARVVHGVVAGDAPELDLTAEVKLHKAVLQAIHEGIVTAAHDVSEGGVAVALAEMAIAAAPGARGCQVNVFVQEGRTDGNIFGESQSRILLTCGRDDVLRMQSILIENGVPRRLLGDVTDDGRFRMAVLSPGTQSEFIFRRTEIIDLPVDDLAEAWKEGLPREM